ncbi:hypothetical protein [Ferrimonas marina]|nr:hypothetical protein [Ferrimonas marina]
MRRAAFSIRAAVGLALTLLVMELAAVWLVLVWLVVLAIRIPMIALQRMADISRRWKYQLTTGVVTVHCLAMIFAPVFMVFTLAFAALYPGESVRRRLGLAWHLVPARV